MTEHDDTTPEQFAADRLDIPLADLPDEEIVFVGVADGSDAGDSPTNQSPEVSILAETEAPEVDDSVAFAADASDPDGSVTSYEWTIDGEVVGSSLLLTRTFEERGDHQVAVTVTDDDGARASASRTVTANDPPTVRISGPGGTPPTGRKLGVDINSESDFGDKTFSAEASDPDGSVESYQWSVDGEPAGTGPTVTLSFARSQAFRRQLRVVVTDDAGGTTAAPASVFADLSGADILDADLENANLSGGDLSDADLRFTNLRRANLSDADLRNANLFGVVTFDADLSGAKLSGADLENAALNGSNLSDADLSDANLENAALDYTDLTGTELKRANLQEAGLLNADVSHADFTDANMSLIENIDSATGKSSADFTGTQFEGEF